MFLFLFLFLFLLKWLCCISIDRLQPKVDELFSCKLMTSRLRLFFILKWKKKKEILSPLCVTMLLIPCITKIQGSLHGSNCVAIQSCNWNVQTYLVGGLEVRTHNSPFTSRNSYIGLLIQISGFTSHKMERFASPNLFTRLTTISDKISCKKIWKFALLKCRILSI